MVQTEILSSIFPAIIEDLTLLVALFEFYFT